MPIPPRNLVWRSVLFTNTQESVAWPLSILLFRGNQTSWNVRLKPQPGHLSLPLSPPASLSKINTLLKLIRFYPGIVGVVRLLWRHVPLKRTWANRPVAVWKWRSIDAYFKIHYLLNVHKGTKDDAADTQPPSIWPEVKPDRHTEVRAFCGPVLCIPPSPIPTGMNSLLFGSLALSLYVNLYGIVLHVYRFPINDALSVFFCTLLFSFGIAFVRFRRGRQIFHKGPDCNYFRICDPLYDLSSLVLVFLCVLFCLCL